MQKTSNFNPSIENQLTTSANESIESECTTSIDKAAVLGNNSKPLLQPIDSSVIPEELKELDRWLNWNWRWNDARQKWDKPPINGRTGGAGSSTNPSTWCSFDDALDAVNQGRCDGIGFVLGEEGDIHFAGIDLDDCRDLSTGELTDTATDIISSVNSYCEVSPTQTGVKLLVRSKQPPERPTKNKAGTVEIYGGGRYFTITGQRIDGSSPSVEERTEELSAVWEAYIGSERSKTKLAKTVQHVSTVPFTVGPDVDSQALTAMLRHQPAKNENDGSNRLFCVACRAVEHDLSDQCAIATIRQYAETFPFPTDWTDQQILDRVQSAAERHDVERGSALTNINTSIKDLSEITPLAWKALQQANNPPTLFRYGGIPSRIEWADTGEPTVRSLDHSRIRHHLARAAKWIRWTQKEEEGEKKKKCVPNYVEPPQAVVNDVLATPDQPLPVLSRIVEAPVFGTDGWLHLKPGYNSASQAYYAPADGFTVPDVPDCPTVEDIDRARSLICDELLGDFPFVSDAERAHAIALLLLPFARGLISGPTPLHLFEKPSPGTGATLLVDMLTFPAIGRAIPMMTEGRDEDEWRKKITAKLIGGSQFIMLDNLRGCLDSAAVASGLTATVWEDRILGKSAMTRLPVRCTWIATGNNPTVSTEISRRTIRVKMDAKVDRPWQRTDFRHPNLRQWATDNRSQLVWAALTLVQAWVAAGRPKGQETLGMYERWAEVIGGILNVADIPGFLSNASEFYDEADAEGEIWRTFLAKWWDRFGKQPTSVRDLWNIVGDEVSLSLGAGSEHSQKVLLGQKLKEHRDRIYDLGDSPGKVILQRGDKKQGAYRWHLTLAV